MSEFRRRLSQGKATRRFRWNAVLACLGALVAAQPARAGTFINVVTDAITLVPTPADYERDYVEVTGAAGLGVKVKNTGSSGLTVLVRSAAAGPAIAVGDLLVRTLTPPGRGGSTLTTYTALGPSNLSLWSSGVPQGPFVQINMDVRVRNLFTYDDAGGIGTTSYTNTLVFTVVEP